MKLFTIVDNKTGEKAVIRNVAKEHWHGYSFDDDEDIPEFSFSIKQNGEIWLVDWKDDWEELPKDRYSIEWNLETILATKGLAMVDPKDMPGV